MIYHVEREDMPNYMSNPKFKISTDYSGTTYTFENVTYLTANIIRIENGFDTATLICHDYESNEFLAHVDAGEAVKIEVKDKNDAAYTTLLDGVVRFIRLPFNKTEGELAVLKCDGAGYGLGEMKCCEEYGTQSDNPTIDRIHEILDDATVGIIPAYTEKILGTATASGFTYPVTSDAGTHALTYLYIPYKPCLNAINDMLELDQAGLGVNAGHHWIVLTDGNLHCTEIGDHSAAAGVAGWTTYLDGTQASATLTQGVDFKEYWFEKLEKEANYILYHSAWRRPKLDNWTEGTAASWGCAGAGASVNNDANHMVGAQSIRCECISGAAGVTPTFFYPSTQDLGWDLTKFGGDYTPAEIHLYLSLIHSAGAPSALTVRFWTSAGNYYHASLLSVLAGALNKWLHFILPVGSNFAHERYGNFKGWTNSAAADWTDINAIEFGFTTGAGVANITQLYVDAMFLQGHVLRAARQVAAYSAADPAKVKFINDSVAKDDSGVANDDSGTIAQLAYAEWLRCGTTPYVGWIITPLIKSLLPGQFVHVHAKPNSAGAFQIDMDMRVTKLVHSFDRNIGFVTKTFVTSDVVNAHARKSYTDLNKLLAAVRPEYQDREASSLKTRDVDITLPLLEKSY